MGSKKDKKYKSSSTLKLAQELGVIENKDNNITKNHEDDLLRLKKIVKSKKSNKKKKKKNKKSNNDEISLFLTALLKNADRDLIKKILKDLELDKLCIDEKKESKKELKNPFIEDSNFEQDINLDDRSSNILNNINKNINNEISKDEKYSQDNKKDITNSTNIEGLSLLDSNIPKNISTNEKIEEIDDLIKIEEEPLDNILNKDVSLEAKENIESKKEESENKNNQESNELLNLISNQDNKESQTKAQDKESSDEILSLLSDEKPTKQESKLDIDTLKVNTNDETKKEDEQISLDKLLQKDDKQKEPQNKNLDETKEKNEESLDTILNIDSNTESKEENKIIENKEEISLDNVLNEKIEPKEEKIEDKASEKNSQDLNELLNFISTAEESQNSKKTETKIKENNESSEEILSLLSENEDKKDKIDISNNNKVELKEKSTEQKDEKISLDELIKQDKEENKNINDISSLDEILNIDRDEAKNIKEINEKESLDTILNIDSNTESKEENKIIENEEEVSLDNVLNEKIEPKEEKIEDNQELDISDEFSFLLNNDDNKNKEEEKTKEVSFENILEESKEDIKDLEKKDETIESLKDSNTPKPTQDNKIDYIQNLIESDDLEEKEDNKIDNIVDEEINSEKIAIKEVEIKKEYDDKFDDIEFEDDSKDNFLSKIKNLTNKNNSIKKPNLNFKNLFNKKSKIEDIDEIEEAKEELIDKASNNKKGIDIKSSLSSIFNKSKSKTSTKSFNNLFRKKAKKEIDDIDEDIIIVDNKEELKEKVSKEQKKEQKPQKKKFEEVEDENILIITNEDEINLDKKSNDSIDDSLIESLIPKDELDRVKKDNFTQKKGEVTLDDIESYFNSSKNDEDEYSYNTDIFKNEIERKKESLKPAKLKKRINLIGAIKSIIGLLIRTIIYTIITAIPIAFIGWLNYRFIDKSGNTLYPLENIREKISNTLSSISPDTLKYIALSISAILAVLFIISIYKRVVSILEDDFGITESIPKIHETFKEKIIRIITNIFKKLLSIALTIAVIGGVYIALKGIVNSYININEIYNYFDIESIKYKVTNFINLDKIKSLINF